MADPGGRLPPTTRAILFDLDGTLVETSNRWAGVLAARLGSVARCSDADALARRIVGLLEMPMNYAAVTLERLGMGALLQGLTDRLRRSRGLATRTSSATIEGTKELLEALAPRYALGVVTTRARPEAHAILRHGAIDALFGTVVTRQDVWFMKPHPAPVLKAARDLGVRPGECVMVGDAATDVRSARRAGAFAVGVLTGIARRDELVCAGAHLVLERASLLLEHLPAPEGGGDPPPREP